MYVGCTFVKQSITHAFVFRVPFAFVCYKNKIMILNTVSVNCKAGATAAVGKLLETERKRFEDTVSDPGSPRRCKDERGIPYVTEENIQKSWENRADAEGYHHVCFMNIKYTRDLLCKDYVVDEMSAEDIASKYEMPIEDMAEVTKVFDRLVPPRIKRFVCRLRSKATEDPPPDSIYDRILKEYKKLTLEQLKKVSCPVE